MSMKTAFTLLLGFMTMSLSAHAQTADFSGTWKLNLAKSFMATEHPDGDYQLTRVIEQKGGHVVIIDSAVHKKVLNIPVPDATTKQDLVTDGKEQEIQVPGFLPFLPPVKELISADWQGDVLDVRERAVDGPGSSERRFYLSPDGAQLIVSVKSHDAFVEIEQRMVFDKQP